MKALTKAIEIARELEARRYRDTFFLMFPDDDVELPDGRVFHARRKYQKHLEFFRAGAKYRERAAMAANRVGKTFGMGGYEMVCHLTGRYPKWWKGKRFKGPIKAWAAGKTNETTRDIVQATLFGNLSRDEKNRRHFDRTGLIPALDFGDISFKAGLDIVEAAKIRHVSGRYSTIGLKSYEQGRGAFEGTAMHVIWLDEEPPAEIYGECVIRTATTDGIVMLTFTPLDGVSDTVKQFLPQAA